MWPLTLLNFLESFWLLFSITVLLISFWLFQLLFSPRSLMTPRLLFPVISFCFLLRSHLFISCSPGKYPLHLTQLPGEIVFSEVSLRLACHSSRFLYLIFISRPLHFELLQGWASFLSVLDLLVISSYFLTLNSIYLMMKTKLPVLLYKRSIYLISFVTLLQG